MRRFSLRWSCFTVVVVVFLAAWGARAAEVSVVDNVLSLPPFLVDEAATGPRWRYAQSPEFEILSRCTDPTTRELAQNYHRLHQLLQLVLPVRLQVKQDVPKTFILYEATLLPATAREMLAARPQAEGPASVVLPDAQATVMRNPRFSDLDALTVFASMPNLASDRGGRRVRGFEGDPTQGVPYHPGLMYLTPSYVGYLLGNRVPELPSWFVSGFMGAYPKMKFSDDAVALEAMVWLGEKETRAIKNGSGAGAETSLLPMAELLAGPGENPAHTLVWFAQAELFYRWAMEGTDATRREAFWKFVERASLAPPDEAMFKDCFGGDFAWGGEQLRTFLKTAVRKPVAWRLEDTARLPAVSLRDATGGEIARIKGDWERLAYNYVRLNSPELEARYLANARRTLRRAYDQGDRDPRLLATLGLGECDAGNVRAARDFLEQAAAGGVVRPRAYLELARLRFAEQRDRPAGMDGRLGADQVASVLAPLATARRQAPALPEVYELMVDVRAASVAPLQRSDLEALEEGVAFFPQHAELRTRTALLLAAQGFSAEAAQLADTGMRFAPDAATRARFGELKTRFGAK
jgi:hypothetical protein